jgi:hypothetical protein
VTGYLKFIVTIKNGGGWIQLRFILRRFVNVIMNPKYNNIIKNA